jgi:hypothetical protein
MQSYITFPAHCNSIWKYTELYLHCISATDKVLLWQRCKDFASVYAVGKKKILHQTCYKSSNVSSRCDSCVGQNIKLNASTVFTVKGLHSRQIFSAETLIWSGDKHHRLCNAELLCGESEEFLSKHFNSSLVICETIFFTDIRDLIPLIYRKYCIRYSIFKLNAQNILGAPRIHNRAAMAFKRLTAASI